MEIKDFDSYEKIKMPFVCKQFAKIYYDEMLSEEYKKQVLINEIKDSVCKALNNKTLMALLQLLKQTSSMEEIETWFKLYCNKFKDYEKFVIEHVIMYLYPNDNKSVKVKNWMQDAFWYEWVTNKIKSEVRL